MLRCYPSLLEMSNVEMRPLFMLRRNLNLLRTAGKRLTVKFCCAISYTRQIMTIPVKEKGDHTPYNNQLSILTD